MGVSLASKRETEALGRMIGQALKGGEVLALIGELGAGKTTVVRGIAAGLGIAPDSVSSPTFILAHEYHGRLSLYHLDLYRLASWAEVEERGLFGYFTEEASVAIEWPDRFISLLPKDRLEIALFHRSPTGRDASLTATGPRSSRLLAGIRLSYRQLERSANPVLRRMIYPRRGSGP